MDRTDRLLVEHQKAVSRSELRLQRLSLPWVLTGDGYAEWLSLLASTGRNGSVSKKSTAARRRSRALAASPT
jgi:hypothetical protein